MLLYFSYICIGENKFVALFEFLLKMVKSSSHEKRNIGTFVHKWILVFLVVITTTICLSFTYKNFDDSFFRAANFFTCSDGRTQEFVLTNSYVVVLLSTYNTLRRFTNLLIYYWGFETRGFIYFQKNSIVNFFGYFANFVFKCSKIFECVYKHWECFRGCCCNLSTMIVVSAYSTYREIHGRALYSERIMHFLN